MMKKRIALLILTGACLLGTFPSFASQSVKVSMYGSKGTEYTKLPDAETLQRDAGFSPKAPSTLAGGYQFDEGRITESFDIGANGAETNRCSGINFKYTKSDNRTSKTVTLSAEPASDQSFSDRAVKIQYGEITLYYSEIQANSISWIDGDVFYMLMDINKKVSKDELAAISKELIDLDAASSNIK